MSLSIKWGKDVQIKGVLPWVVCFFASLFFAYELLQMHVMNALSPKSVCCWSHGDHGDAWGGFSPRTFFSPCGEFWLAKSPFY